MVTLVLVDEGGTVLGALPPFGVAIPYRQEAAELVATARREYGAQVTILRLLEGDTYLAELDGSCDTPLRPVDIALHPHPLRAPYAEPGGPAASLAWARSLLGPVRATQLRTWNLSSIWRLEYADGVAWLKEVPPFFWHEGPLLDWLDHRYPGFAPRPLAIDGGRMLLADVPGSDRYGASAEDRLPMLRALHDVQIDQPPPSVPQWTFDGVESIVDTPWLAGRLAAIAECGLPDALVHGDFHPGNVRGTVVLDWGDSFIGNPAYDLYRMVEQLSPAEAAPLVTAWCRWWRRAVPGCDPLRAYALLEPVVALRNALAYARFLARIEPSEHVYHADDVPAWLDRTAALLRGPVDRASTR